MRRYVIVTASVVGAIGLLGAGTALAAPDTFDAMTSWALGPDCDDGQLLLECDPPFPTEPSPWPEGGDGTVVVLGDSFTAGEGAPQVLSVPGLANGAPMVWTAEDSWLPGTDVTGNRCHRSAMSYGFLLAQELNMDLEFRACSGSVSDDYFTGQAGRRDQDGNFIPGQQEPPFPEDTELVIFSFGGNDAGFADVVRSCLLSGYVKVPAFLEFLDVLHWSSCEDEADDKARNAAASLGVAGEPGAVDPAPDRGIDQVFEHVRRLAPPDARVIAMSYPMLFPDHPTAACGIGSGAGAVMAVSEQAAINALVVRLNGLIEANATAHGIEFVDMTHAFTGARGDHGLCVDAGPDADAVNEERWVNRMNYGDLVNVGWENLTSIKDLAFLPEIKESVHPNTRGQQVYFEHALACWKDTGSCSNTAELMAKRVQDEIDALVAEREAHVQQLIADSDWKELSYPAAGCLSKEEWQTQYFANRTDEEFEQWWAGWTVDVMAADLTGGGPYKQIYARLECPSITSSWPDTVVVFDASGDVPRVMKVLGEDWYFKTSQVTPGVGQITMEGVVVAGRDANALPTHWGRLTYVWNGSELVLETSDLAVTTQPIRHEGLSTGDYYGVLRAVEGDEISLDLVEWFTGPAATEACEEDGIDVSLEGGAWCFDYYVRNDNDLVRAMQVAPDTRISFYEMDGRPAELSLADFAAQRPDESTWGPYWHISTSDGAVTVIEQVFVP